MYGAVPSSGAYLNFGQDDWPKRPLSAYVAADSHFSGTERLSSAQKELCWWKRPCTGIKWTQLMVSKM